MAQYIEKSSVIAEIERRIKEIDGIGTYLSPKGVLTNLLCHLNTLEVKEVDLEKYYHDFLQKEWFGNNCVRTISEIMAVTAKHFFELGLKAQKNYINFSLRRNKTLFN